MGIMREKASNLDLLAGWQFVLPLQMLVAINTGHPVQLRAGVDRGGSHAYSMALASSSRLALEECILPEMRCV